jgi:acetylornithine/succinyldiaminopimelate/putrescine aminotransferase
MAMTAIEKRSREDWQALDKEHHLHPFTDHKDLHKKRSRIITRAEGVYIYDADGSKILDGMSGLWCVTVLQQLFPVCASAVHRTGRNAQESQPAPIQSRVFYGLGVRIQ